MPGFANFCSEQIEKGFRVQRFEKGNLSMTP
jgi:hypothetical protein